MSALQSSYVGPDLGRATIICSWVFAALAGIGVCTQIVKARTSVKADDILIFSAFVVSLMLVAQTTWAVIDEGQGEHVNNQLRTHLALIARVCY